MKCMTYHAVDSSQKSDSTQLAFQTPNIVSSQPGFTRVYTAHAARDQTIFLTTKSERASVRMDDPTSGSNTHLTWVSISLAFTFIALDAFLSLVFGLNIGTSLVTAAVRCVLQLALMALVLKSVFQAHNPWIVAGLACTLRDRLHLGCI